VKIIPVNTKPPEGWKEMRFRYAATTAKGRLPSKEGETGSSEDLLPYLSMEYLRGENPAPHYVSSKGMLTASEKDVLLLWDGSNAGEFLYAKGGVVSSTAALVSPTCFSRRFLFWLCKASEPVLKTFTNGMGIPHVDGEFLKDLRLPYPVEIETQRRIADYLDRETGRIDALIAAKERLLALLAEKRAALISQLVTRGLDPSVETKPSGLEWVGEIPKHWEVRRAKNLFSLREDLSEDGTEELLTVSHITGVTTRSEKTVYMFEADDKTGYKRCKTDDFVINTLWAWMGAMGVSPQEGIVSPAYHVYTSKGQLLPQYVELLCRSLPFIAEVARWSKGVWSSRLRLYPESFFEIHIPLPPLEEQQAIVEVASAAQKRDSVLRGALENSITLARERRAALISAAVCGQIPI